MSRMKSSRAGHRIRFSFHIQVLGTLGCVVLYRLLANLPLPFADPAFLSAFMASRSFGMMDILSGGSMSRLSVATLGISPYVSASIIVQLLGAVFPVISLLQRSGPVGQKKIRSMTLGISAGISVISGSMLATNYRNAGILPDSFVFGIVIPVFIMAACSVGLAALGCYIDEKLFGRGVSILIAAGVLSSLPGSILSAGKAMYNNYGTAGTIMFICGFLVFCGMVFWLVNCRLELKLSYSGKSVADEMNLDAVSVLPLVALPGGVMPVIFASYFLSIPSIFGAVSDEVPVIIRFLDMTAWFDPAQPLMTIGALVYAVLIWLFGRMSQIMSVNATELSESLRRGGCTIEGVASGPDTEKFLAERIRVMTDFGSIGLCFVAIVPTILASVLDMPGLGYIGTSVLLVISVMQETLAELHAMFAGLAYNQCLPAMQKGPRAGNPFALLEKARVIK